MSTEVLSDVGQATTEWLTSVLREAGRLPVGCVENVQWSGETSVHAQIGRLKLTYSADAPTHAPTSLFLKICKPTSAQFGDSEVLYYTEIAARMQAPPMPACYHAAYEATTQRYHLLLDDLPETHQVNWNVTPTLPRAARAVDALAQLHACWWDTEVRRELQRPLLARYLEQLRLHGIAGYDAEILWEDYRLAAMQSFYVVTDWCIDPVERKQIEWVWWPQLEKTLAAYKDLDCASRLRR